jgi:hypothetical protein
MQGERKHDPIVMILVLQLVLFPKKKGNKKKGGKKKWKGLASQQVLVSPFLITPNSSFNDGGLHNKRKRWEVE